MFIFKQIDYHINKLITQVDSKKDLIYFHETINEDLLHVAVSLQDNKSCPLQIDFHCHSIQP